MIFWEKSQFADFMSSLFCSYGSGVVSKSYSKIKLTVRYVVPLCAIFVLFFIHALQPTLWSIKHEGVRPWKMGASLLNASAPKTMVSELPIPKFLACASTNPKAPSWKTRTHMADGECCWMSMFFVASEPWRTAVENLHSCRRNSFRMTQSRFLVIWAMEIHSMTEHGHYQGRQVQDWNMMAAKCFEII